MTEIVYGCDISAWQGHAGEDFDINELWESGMRTVYMKAGQDDWVDKCFLYNYEFFRKSKYPWLLGAYWFTTTMGALQQAKAFLNVTDPLKLDLPLCLDVEFYTPVNNATQFTPAYYGSMMNYLSDGEVVPVSDYRYNRVPITARFAQRVYSYSIATEQTVDTMARQLAGHQGWKEPCIYTNVYSGNTFIKKLGAAMAKRHLFVANWPSPGQTLLRPTLPNAWKAADIWYMWQYGVEPGKPHGFPGSLDHDKSGPEFSPPTPVVNSTIQFKSHVFHDGIDMGIYTGKLEQE